VDDGAEAFRRCSLFSILSAGVRASADQCLETRVVTDAVKLAGFPGSLDSFFRFQSNGAFELFQGSI